MGVGRLAPFAAAKGSSSAALFCKGAIPAENIIIINLILYY